VAILMQVASASGILFTVYLKDHSHVSSGWFAYFTAAFSLGSTAGALILGFLTDMKGSRTSLMVGFLGMLAGLAAVLEFRTEYLLGSSYFFAGFFSSASSVVTTVVILDLAGHQHSVAHLGLFNTLLAPWTAFMPILLGQLAESAGYLPAFSISGAACVAGLAVLLRNRRFGKDNPPLPPLTGPA
jgi:MFS family permease